MQGFVGLFYSCRVQNLPHPTGNNLVKAYLITTGTIFALIGVLHLVRAIDEWSLLATHPWSFLSMAALGVVAAALSAWAWRLLRQNRS
jgi:hypothetical protein